jgi:hypothetical protein
MCTALGRSFALLEALGDKFAEADINGNKELDARELYLHTRRRLPELLKEINAREFAQVPIRFSPSGELFSVAKAKE